MYNQPVEDAIGQGVTLTGVALRGSSAPDAPLISASGELAGACRRFGGLRANRFREDEIAGGAFDRD